MTVEEICNRLSRLRLPLEDEKAMQPMLADALAAMGVAFEREVKCEGGIIDFLIPGLKVGIEVKVKGTHSEVCRQLWRYAGDARIDRLVLVTGKAFRLPESVGRRAVPVSVVNLGRAWL